MTWPSSLSARELEDLISRVYAYVAYRVGEGPAADDITSEVFSRALRYRRTFDSRRGELASWLLGIARRCILDAARPDLVATDVVPEERFADDLDAVAQRLDLVHAIRHLTPRDAELIALKYGADLTAREIGELLGMRPNTVEVAVHRALVALRTLLDAETLRPGSEPQNCLGSSSEPEAGP